MQLINERLDALWPLLMAYGVNLVSAIAILIFGIWFAARSRKWVRAVVNRVPHLDSSLAGFFGNLLRYLVLLITALAVLGKFGIDTTSLIAVIGAAGLAIGLALQGTLSNVAAGVMLLIFRPFKTNDYVEVAGNLAGTIRTLSLFSTELVTVDNLSLIVPNNAIWSQPIKNFNRQATRRLDVLVGISYEDNIGQAIDALLAEADADQSVLSEPAPMAVVNLLDASSVQILLRVWTATPDYWPVRFALNRRVKERLDEEGITIPYPTSTQYTFDGRRLTDRTQATDQPKPETPKP
ncbi:MAG: mechanosensitive ion channel [Parvibaculum sp.]|nr:mechanosensitive ion channel [Parvibaculum sp.]